MGKLFILVFISGFTLSFNQKIASAQSGVTKVCSAEGKLGGFGPKKKFFGADANIQTARQKALEACQNNVLYRNCRMLPASDCGTNISVHIPL